ncbi:hypothetical protein F511_27510 [Dorcoceras hygrometricum]|uniref:Dystroglycan-like n=1 Tax=Dorcoceras hygrometricum TaxID=472368 RepID=A0A2Z7DDP3_9LAMI|nr:hypothetical protein F511_27510 [Dorcoceras hygrometricum]
MASSFYSNSQHIDFDSVLAMDDQGIESMFQALMASGLAGFLGCPAVIYEAALVDFFENASVREGVIINTVAGQLVEISEWFAESFDLPLDGLGDLSEIPKDVIFDARSIVSLSGEPVSLSGKKFVQLVSYSRYYRFSLFHYFGKNSVTPADPSPDISKALNQLRASIDEIGKQDDGAKHRDTLLLHLHDFEKQVIARLDAQDRVLGALRSFLLDAQSASSFSSDEFMNFDDAPASISLPSDPSPDISKALNQLRASIDEIGKQDDGAKHRDTLLLHLHDFEKPVIARLDAQDRVLGALRRDSNDQRTLLSLELQSSHKQLGTQIVTTGLDVVDVRRVVRESHQELNARINSLDEQVAATQNDLLEFSAQAQQTLNIITSQLIELVAYINRGGDNKEGESSSSRRPLPTPVHQSEGTGDAVRITEPTQADIDNANREILERMRNEDRERERRERSRGSRSGSYKRRRF